MKQTIIFDMDGLMFDTESIARRAWQGASAELGFPIPDDLYLTFIGQPNPACEALLLRHFGPQYPLESFRLRSGELHESEVMTRGVPLKAGLMELLNYLEEQHFLKGIATSSLRTTAMRCLGELAPRFYAITTGDEVTHGKPAPDIYLLAARKLGVEPSQCLVLEDSENGARSALAAGMSVVVVPDLVQPSSEIKTKAYQVCESLHEVLTLLKTRDCAEHQPIVAQPL